MNRLFLNAVNLSITAGYITLAILLIRKFFKNCPKWFIVFLWSFVALRLIIPVIPESEISLIPSGDTFEMNLLDNGNGDFYINTGFDIIDDPVNEYMGDKYYEGVTVRYNFKNDLTDFLAKIWIAGITVMLSYAAYSYIRLKRMLATATKYNENIRQSEFIKGPFVMGIFSPKIYIPYGISENDAVNVISHEKMHIKRLDHISKILAYVLLCIYWFNPLMWLTFSTFCKDLELACDEAVIKNLGDDEKKSYSLSLLSFSVEKNSFAISPLAFGEVGIKDRIKGIMQYKRPTGIIFFLCTVMIVSFAVFFMTNPPSAGIDDISPCWENLFDDPEYVYVMNGVFGKEYLLTEKESIKIATDALRKIEINKHELSKSLDEDRPKDRVIDLGDSWMYFNNKCTEVWIDDTVKPSYTYRVKNPEYVLQTFFIGYFSDITFAEKFNGEIITEFSDPAESNIRRFEIRNSLDEYIGIIADTDKTVLEFSDDEIYNAVFARAGEDLWDGVCPGGVYITLVPHTEPGKEIGSGYEWFDATEIYFAEKIIVGGIDENYFMADGN